MGLRVGAITIFKDNLGCRSELRRTSYIKARVTGQSVICSKHPKTHSKYPTGIRTGHSHWRLAFFFFFVGRSVLPHPYPIPHCGDHPTTSNDLIRNAFSVSCIVWPCLLFLAIQRECTESGLLGIVGPGRAPRQRKWEHSSTSQ